MREVLTPRQLNALQVAQARTGVRMLTVIHVPYGFALEAERRATRDGELYLAGLDILEEMAA